MLLFIGSIITFRDEIIANGTFPLYKNGTLPLPKDISMIWNVIYKLYFYFYDNTPNILE